MRQTSTGIMHVHCVVHGVRLMCCIVLVTTGTAERYLACVGRAGERGAASPRRRARRHAAVVHRFHAYGVCRHCVVHVVTVVALVMVALIVMASILVVVTVALVVVALIIVALVLAVVTVVFVLIAFIIVALVTVDVTVVFLVMRALMFALIIVALVLVVVTVAFVMVALIVVVIGGPLIGWPLRPVA